MRIVCGVLLALGMMLPLAVNAQQGEKLTEVEVLKVEKAKLLVQIRDLQRDRTEWRSMFAQCTGILGKSEIEGATNAANTFTTDLVQAIEVEHKGYTLSPEGTLVPKKK